MARYTLSPAAKNDLRLIGRYTQEQWGIDQRNHYIDLLTAAFKSLADKPTLGRKRDDIKSGLLNYLCGSHVIYFRRQQQDIEILRVLHQKMKAQLHL